MCFGPRFYMPIKLQKNDCGNELKNDLRKKSHTEEKLKDTKEVIGSRKKGQTAMTKGETDEQTMFHKTVLRKLKIKQHQPH